MTTTRLVIRDLEGTQGLGQWEGHMAFTADRRLEGISAWKIS
jgi:hypothetical protein